jgi:YggT family protein
MFIQIAHFLVDTVFTFFVVLLLLRFHFQWLRVPFHNPAGEFVLVTTSWMVMPVRRVIPGLRGYDIPTLLLAWALESINEILQIWIVGADPRFVAILVIAFVELLRYSLYLLIFAVLMQVVLSWFRAYSPFSPVLEAITRPFLRPFRRFIPPIGVVDLSPAVLMLVLIILVRFILPEVQRLAVGLG